jgi:hypothetical protein
MKTALPSSESPSGKVKVHDSGTSGTFASRVAMVAAYKSATTSAIVPKVPFRLFMGGASLLAAVPVPLYRTEARVTERASLLLRLA